MLTIAEARALIDRHLGQSSRATHSLFVGHLMREVAALLGEDAALWEITGLCHDLDFDLTKDDWSRHGLLTAEWLDGRLPVLALEAIRAHDHRTGVVSTEPIARSLKLADALAIIRDLLAEETVPVLRAPDATDRLVRALAARPYLAPLVIDNAQSLGLPLDRLADILAAAPPSS